MWVGEIQRGLAAWLNTLGLVPGESGFELS